MKTKMCPACGVEPLDPVEVRNALSRYCSKYICSQCGVREAFEGFFWIGVKFPVKVEYDHLHGHRIPHFGQREDGSWSCRMCGEDVTGKVMKLPVYKKRV